MTNKTSVDELIIELDSLIPPDDRAEYGPREEQIRRIIEAVKASDVSSSSCKVSKWDMEVGRMEKRVCSAKAMRGLANEIRSPETRMVSTDGALARMAEAIATLLEELPW